MAFLKVFILVSTLNSNYLITIQLLKALLQSHNGHNDHLFQKLKFILWLIAASTHWNRTYTLIAANDAVLGSSVTKYSPTDCQRAEVLNKNLVKGRILLCGYSFNFVVGAASIKKVSETAKSLGAAGFVLVVENVSPGTKFDPVPTKVPGILITDVHKSMVSFSGS